MTLLRKLLFALTALIMVLLAGNLVVSTLNARDYFSRQMGGLAQDTATSLGLTMTQAAQEHDVALVQSMVDVIFDRGYFLSINYSDMHGKVLVSRAREVSIAGVPKWFIDAIPIAAPPGNAEVQSGWMRLGKLHVVTHPGYAYQELWGQVRDQMGLFLFTAVLSYGLIGLGAKYLLRPLTVLGQRASTLGERRFQPLSPLPKSAELRQLAQALNAAGARVHQMLDGQQALIERLRTEVHTDSLTQLSNRDEFEARINAWLNGELGAGVAILLVVSMANLTVVNAKLGRVEGDRLVQKMAQALAFFQKQWPHALLGRLNGADFGVFLPGLEAEDLNEKMRDLPFSYCPAGEMLPTHVPLSVQMGGAMSRGGVALAQLLAAADTGLRQARANHRFFGRIDIGAATPTRSAGDWLSLIEPALAGKNMRLALQPLVDVREAAPAASWCEVFCRIASDAQIFEAAQFWPLVERLALVDAMDKSVMQLVVTRLQQDHTLRLRVNIGWQSLARETFVHWLGTFLASLDKTLVQRLMLEVPEFALVHKPELARRCVLAAVDAGIDVALDHFGLSPAALGFVRELPIARVKIDRRFIHHIHLNRENHFYVQTLTQAVHACGVKVDVEGVELAEDSAALRALDIDLQQGFVLGMPEVMLPLDD